MIALYHPAHAPELSQSCCPIGDAEAARIAMRLYGRQGQMKRFATEKDDTYLVDGGKDQQFILKIAHPSEALDELDLQTSVMRHVRLRAPELPTPQVHPGLDGTELPVVETEAGELRVVRLLTFLPGTPLDRTSSVACQREHIGQVLAHLRHAMADFDHPAASRKLAWDVTNLRDLGDLIAHVPQGPRRDWTKAAFDRCVSVLPQLTDCRQQVLHNDFNTSNLVVDTSRNDFIIGIIDFGDTVRTSIAVDVSTALMNQMPKNAAAGRDMFAEPRDVLRGYLRHADLTENELRLIPFLAMGRLALRALLTCWRAGLFPENAAYIMRNTEDGWTHLNWFAGLSTAQISDLLTR